MAVTVVGAVEIATSMMVAMAETGMVETIIITEVGMVGMAAATGVVDKPVFGWNGKAS
jgi:hypothetical protein